VGGDEGEGEHIRKNHKIIAALVITAALAGIVWYICSRFQTQENLLKAASTASSPYRMAIGGLAFYGTSGGQKSISIKADRFVIEKKKFGFLSFSLINVARLENAVIDVYGLKAGKLNPPSSASPFPSGAQTGKTLNFDHVLSRESFSMFPTKNIGAIEAGPIIVNFHNENNVFTSLTASSGTVRLKEQDILFSGNVRVTSGPRELLTDQLMFLPQKGLFDVDKDYTLKTGDGTVQGKRLTTDIHLKPKKPRPLN
jgi:hypothetical protein